MCDDDWMRIAIRQAELGIAEGQSPFGACIVKAGRQLAAAHNLVWQSCDPTAHAEIGAIREASSALGTIDLAGCTIYSTCEPCPMCFAACHWARISRVVYGASIADALAAGFNELAIPAEEMKRQGGSRIEIIGGCLREEAVALFAAWQARSLCSAY